MGAVVDGIAQKDIPTIASAFRLADDVNNVVTATIDFAAARDENARASGLNKLKEYDQDLRATMTAIAATEGREKTIPIENLRESIFVTLGHLDQALARGLHGAKQYRQRTEAVQTEYVTFLNVLMPWIKTAKGHFIDTTKAIFAQERDPNVLQRKVLRASILDMSLLQSLLEVQTAADLLNGLYGQVGTTRDSAVLERVRGQYAELRDRLLRSADLLPPGAERETLDQSLGRFLAAGRENEDGLFVLRAAMITTLHAQDKMLLDTQGLATDLVRAIQKMVDETRVTLTAQIEETLI
ncbi:MAG: hypothetical protein FD149_1752 [Rhodospirillaceae bacterium]|nr:MAG: hypothetical protein FD149_1752 [Rhodospirillaceae bacterium]